MLYLARMKKVGGLLRTIILLLVLGVSFDGLVDMMDRCQNDAPHKCAALCHTSGCQTHYYQATVIVLASETPGRESTFASFQIMISSLLTRKIFNPPKTQA